MFKKGRRFFGRNKDIEMVRRYAADMPKYDVYIWWSEEDDCYIATLSEMDDCIAHGDTPKEAAEELEIAMGLRAKCDIELGQETPGPQRTSFMEKLIHHHLDDSSVPLEG